MNCPIVNLFSNCSSCGSSNLFCLRLTFAVMPTIFGALIAWKPKKTIDIQTALYRPLNWKLEPISMEKEIKNTRITGIAVFILGIITLVYILLS